MSVKNFNPRTIVLLIFIALAATLRVVFNFNDEISALANFSPIGAMAIFGGAYFNKTWKAFTFPLLMLFISDFILHETVFKQYRNGILYSGWYWVYGAFALMVIVGRWLLKEISVAGFLVSVLVCAAIHWVVTDMGVWIGSKTYSQDLSGFVTCLINAIPYEWRFLAGTLCYGIVLFGLFEWIRRKYKSYIVALSN